MENLVQKIADVRYTFHQNGKHANNNCKLFEGVHNYL